MRRVLFIPDTHAPYHDEAAWKLMLKVAHDFKPHTVVHLGDLVDYYAISSFSKDPQRVALLVDEVKQAKCLVRQMEDLGADEYIFCEGNHEGRLPRYLQTRAPELFGLVTTKQLLELDKWQIVPWKDHTKVGDMYVTHEAGADGKYAAAHTLATFADNVIAGHSHRLQRLEEGTATGRPITSIQLGWLGNVKAVDYQYRVKALKNWAHGFGVGYVKGGVTYVDTIRIRDYTCVHNGRYYRV